MKDTTIVQLFEWMDELTLLLQEQKDEPYLDSLGSTLEAFFYGDVQMEMTADLREKIDTYVDEMETIRYSDEELHKAIQLVILKGMQKTTQHQHAITPETIALFIGYLAGKLTENKSAIRIFDPVSGTGNLLLTVMKQLNKETEAYASEIDTTLLKISLLYANLLKQEVEFFHQDSLTPLLLDPVDLIVADLPVGYYPDDIQASRYALQAEAGHSYAHHLLIEQSLTYTKEGGFLILLIPESLFESEQSAALHTYLQKHTHIIGLLQLSETTFKSKENKKSIFILQKRGKDTKGVQQPLLAMVPSFKNTTAMKDMMDQMNQWFQEADILSE